MRDWTGDVGNRVLAKGEKNMDDLTGRMRAYEGRRTLRAGAEMGFRCAHRRRGEMGFFVVMENSTCEYIIFYAVKRFACKNHHTSAPQKYSNLEILGKIKIS